MSSGDATGESGSASTSPNARHSDRTSSTGAPIVSATWARVNWSRSGRTKRSPARANSRPRSWAATISSSVQPCSTRKSSSSSRSAAAGEAASYRPAAVKASTFTEAFCAKRPQEPPRPQGRKATRTQGPSDSACLAVGGVLAAVRTELLQLHAIRVVAPVLLGDVVAVLALVARQRDLRTDVGGCHGADLSEAVLRERTYKR